ncbi:MAG TPA: hypothetical protein VII98_07065 [Solirubrobacteraceae bacterium]
MPDRIVLAPGQIETLIHTAALEDLRHETTAADRERALGQAATALDALCGLAEREGADGVWDVFHELDRAQMLAFTTFAILELSRTGFSARGEHVD